MRVDPFYVVNLSGALDQTQATQQQLTNEVSSGLRVTTLGPDPVAVAENAQLLNQIQRDDSFTQTSSLAEGMLQVTDSSLGSVVTQLTQAISLATEGNNGTLNSSDLKSIANQIAGIRDEVLSLANTSYQGQYVFAGSASGTAPFALDNTTTPPTVNYSGNGTVNVLQVPNGQTVSLNLPGSQVFASATSSVFGALNNLIQDFSNGSTASSASDLASLNTAMNWVSQQRVGLDNSLNQVRAASSAATAESTQLTTVQTNLMQADIPAVASQLSLTESQQSALINVISALGSGSLFDKL